MNNEVKKSEEKIKKLWQQEKIFKAEDFSKRPKFYCLDMFPYPSGEGLHIGHIEGYTASDIFSRYKKMRGFNVLHPMGWDAFGLPAENYAIKTKTLPRDSINKNVANFKRQLGAMGFGYDWSREINTTDPEYYRWTQWIFLKLYEHGLAYEADAPVNWCTKDKVVLADEEVINGHCERDGAEVVKKNLKQWMLKITAYADRLLEDLDDLDWPEKIKEMQRNWIGRSEGAEIEFPIVIARSKATKQSKFKNKEIASLSARNDGKIKVFTTRVDTFFGVTYLVVAPEHNIISNLKSKIENPKEVEEYIKKSKSKSDLERTGLAKDKTGVELKGIKAINPANNEEVPVWVADYVLGNYGTGAVMAVPAHDQRDFEFAHKYNLPIEEVIIPKTVDKINPPKNGNKTVERRAIQAILINPKNNKVLCLKWKKFPWTTFITGGVEGDEDIVESAKREIVEETGYKNIRYVRTLGGPVESHFYAAHKNVNRKALFSALVFELVDEKRDEISDEEKAIHSIFWMTWDEISKDKNLTCAEYDIWLDRFHNPEHAFTDYGVLVNSNGFDGLESEEAKKKITKKLKEIGAGDFAINYKLHDWVFSRQRFWGEPMPLVFCEHCKKEAEISNLKSQISKLRKFNQGELLNPGWIVVEEKDLPVELPKVKYYKPTDTGQSPLAGISDWVNVKCPRCGRAAKRETNTMPQWAGSSWYFLAFATRKNSQFDSPAGERNSQLLKYWLPVDLYIGGAEHAVLHLLYARFWTKFLYDIGICPVSEPFEKLVNQGIILASDGRKMSKSLGNVVNPEAVIAEYNADTLRLYEMFMGPLEDSKPWSTKGILGVKRFLDRIAKLKVVKEKVKLSSAQEKILNLTIKKVTDDIENLRYNTAISAMMVLLRELESMKKVGRETFEIFLKLLSPFAPFTAEYLWLKLGNKKSIFNTGWPKAKEVRQEKKTTIVVQINGKLRDTFETESESEKEIVKKALGLERVRNFVNGKKPKQIIYIPRRLVNFVV